MPDDTLNPWTAWQADPTLPKPGSGRPYRCENVFPDDAPTYWNWGGVDPDESRTLERKEVIAMATAPTPTERTAADVFAALAAPFAETELRRRMLAGREITYITARTAQRRLSEVCGPDGWECRVTPAPESVRCSITIHLPDGRTITREALGGYPDMPTLEDRVKGGDSDAFKRCASLFGVGQYLYGEEVYGGPAPSRETHRRDDREHGQRRPHANGAPAAGNERQQRRDAWVGSRNAAGRGREPERQEPAPSRGQERDGFPADGGKLFGWLKDQGQELLNAIVRFGVDEGYPELMKQWNAEEVREAYREARHLLDSDG